METLKEKCEAMRATTDYRLPKKTYAMVMIDGKNFSRLIKNHYEKPFDDKFINMMNEVAIYVCKNVQGCKFAYTQSDEITFVLTDFENEETSAYFDYRLCKMLSIIPSLATAKFNQLVTLNLLDTPCSTEDMKQIIKHMSLAQFDCKVWNTDNFNDVFAYFLWRQIDCVRNSKHIFRIKNLWENIQMNKLDCCLKRKELIGMNILMIKNTDVSYIRNKLKNQFQMGKHV